jgi:hypothetical protein
MATFKDINRDLMTTIQSSLSLQENENEIYRQTRAISGKSGEFFFFSANEKIVLKSISSSEVDTIKDFLRDYQAYLRTNPFTLLARIYGVFKVSYINIGYSMFILVMQNTNYGIPKTSRVATYDMKGSKQDRNSFTQQERKLMLKTPSIPAFTEVAKDEDFEELEKGFAFDYEVSEEIMAQAALDTEFLQKHNLIDYSLMASKITLNGLPEATIARAFKTRSGYAWTLGIIDYLQDYNIKKKLENTLKETVTLKPGVISCQPPEYYRTRFLEFMGKLVYSRS